MMIRQSTGISSALASFAFWSMHTLDGSWFLACRDAGIGLLARLDEPSRLGESAENGCLAWLSQTSRFYVG